MKIYSKKELMLLLSVVAGSLICAVILLSAKTGSMLKISSDFVPMLNVFGNQLSIEWALVDVPVEEEIAEEPEPEYIPPQRGYSMEEKELLAQMMFAEEGVFLSVYADDPATAERVFKLAGSVILNRRNSGYMGAKSVADVLYAHGQYADRTKQVIEEGQNVPSCVYTWADDLMRDGPIAPQEVVFQAEFSQGSGIYEQIGNQYFCMK